jgi:hypothetical protein
MTKNTHGAVSSSRLGSGLDTPSGRGFIALLEGFRSTGGTAPGEIVGRLLEEHQVANAVSLAKLVYTDQVFGFEWRAKLWIPMFQFDAENLSLKATAQRVRSALPSPWHGWILASWFATPSAALDGCSPANMLDSDFDAVMRTASLAHALEEPDRTRWPHQVAAHA